MKEDKKHKNQEQDVELVEGTEVSGEQAAATEGVEYKDKYLRLLSEFTQYQKQKEEEVKAMAIYGNKSLLIKMIDLLDDMEIGLQQEGLSEESKAILEMLLGKFVNTLTIEGVKEIGIKIGDNYDAQRCEVISVVEHEQKGKIVHVARKGYELSGRVLRTAKVIVGK